MKKLLISVLGVSVAVSGWAPGAFASESEKAPFKACENVKLLKAPDKATREHIVELQKNGCNTIAIEYGLSNIQAQDAATTILIGTMLRDVARDQYLPDLKERRKYWEDVKSCFEKSKPSPECQEKISNIKENYGNFVGSLRQDLAQSRLAERKGIDHGGKTVVISKTGVSRELHPFDAGKLAFLPNTFPDAVSGSLQDAEMNVAEAIYKSSSKNKELGSKDAALIKKLESEAKKQYVTDLSQGIQEHGLYLVAYLPKPTQANDDGTPAWSNAEWASTIDRLIQDAKHEEEVVKQTVDANVTSFPAFGSRDLLPTWDKDKRDLLYFSSLGPEMEKYLSKNPQDCGLALAATQWMHSNEYKKMAAGFASMFVGGIGVGVGSQSVGKVGKALAGIAAAGGGWAGFMLVYNDFDNTRFRAKNDFKQLAKIGVEKGKEADVVDPNAYAAAQDAANQWVKNTVVMNAAMMGTLGVGAVAGAGAVKMAKGMTGVYASKSPEARAFLSKLFLSSKDPEKLAASIRKDAPKQFAANAEDNLANTADDLLLAKHVNPHLDEISKSLKPEELDQIQDELIAARRRLVEEGEKTGSCVSHGDCVAKAVAREEQAVKEAKNSCKL